ncbi:MAG: zf-HC2 domain-containing protein [Bacteroidetes bacterium]|nr:zf-HC2 domain-containing protein [Bacteroidota bacterium]
MKHYELEISQFMDNELPADEQKELFIHLSGCEDCRETLSDFMETKKESKSFYNELDAELKSVKLSAAVQQKREKNIYKTSFYFSAAASIILGILFLMRQSNSAQIEKQYLMLEAKYNELNIEHDSVKKEKIKTGLEAKSLSFAVDKNKIMKKHPINQLITDSNKSEAIDSQNNPIAYNEVNVQNPGPIHFVGVNNAYNQKDINAIVKNVLDSLQRPEFYTRDLFYRKTPYVKNGKILIDTSFVRDLFLRKHLDKYFYSPSSKHREENLAINKTVKDSSPDIHGNNYFKPLRRSQNIRVVQVTKNDFLTPQIVGN